VTASWDRNSDTYTTGYRLFYGTAAGSYQWSVDVGNQISKPLNLAAGRYYFVVRAYNASFQYGPASTEVTFTVGSTSSPTANITATRQSATTALVTWQTTNATSATINGTAVALNGSTTMSVSSTTSTTFTLVARNAAGATATDTATVAPAGTAPTANITATRQSATTALVSWQTTNATSATINGTARALNGSATMTVSATTSTTFTLVARNAAGTTARDTATVAAMAPTATITATRQSATTALVTWRTTYATSATINGTARALNGSATMTVSSTTSTTFRLVARNAAGTTATDTATVSALPPTATITATRQSATTALVTWRTTYATSATLNGAAVALSGSATRTVSATTSTTFTLVARNAAGTTATDTATVPVSTSTTAPLRPVNVRASVSGTQVTVTWQRNPSGGAPTSYILYIGRTMWGSEVINGRSLGNVLSATLTLSTGSYYVRLRARNALGNSASSDPVLFRIGSQLSSPTDLTANWSGTQTTLTWVASSADSPETAPTDYVIEAGTAPGLADVAAVKVGEETTFSTDVPYGVYYVRVRAMNDHGDSNPTEELVVAAPGSAQAPEALTTSGEGTTVNLSWSPPAAGGEAPVGYLIEAGSDPGLSDIATIQVGNVTSFTTQAPPGTYFVRVRAINSRGPGLPSNEIIVQK